ncbi:MAG: hypothetical protein O7G31_02970 [Calditrichaeota bacterium]|nr:hypothetical protein [Calditrichota bacterium]
METQAGTVAKCEHRDDEGKLTKLVTYSGAARRGVSTPTDELKVQKLEEYKYDDQGRLVRTDTYRADRVLSSYSNHTHLADGTVIKDTFTAAGTRRYQWVDATLCKFDDRGQTIVAIKGPLPADRDLPHGWGEPVDGISCGAVPSASELPIGNIDVYVTVRNQSVNPIMVSVGHEYWTVSIELRDSQGFLVAKNSEFIQAEMERLRLINRSESLLSEGVQLIPGFATYWGGHLELRNWYADVPPGRYDLSVTRHLNDTGHDLICNSVPIIVGADHPQ